ncbi:NADH-ubiquinone oxidoreductase [Zancudomyces culisetae]|uniref:NADH-ubiquinone oxidoreductase n=1 Tax=Zancudomyces culisetae TaxID=1213189 RepID=A0A1R1PVK8_ZANCU|nr:NADH-ubiquinone oxidoreductase [Zancudomyces culisetae]OMH85000.1 NADH-ubiquinone oxidoreductase [Zancudomyces culisetae]|eukprot:OMH83624.1 NADH-ubiquinone oxidoreductase [Zancudomyces culisetae]
MVEDKQGWIFESAKYTMIGGGVGLMVSAFQNSFQTHNSGAMGVFTRTGGSIAYVAAMGGIFAGVKEYSRISREKDDFWNTVIGGCASGLVAGLRKKSVPAALGISVFMGGSLGLFEYLGGFDGKMGELSSIEREKALKQKFADQIDSTYL